MNRLISFFAKQGIFSNLITAFVFLLGIFSLYTIQREMFPNVKYDIVVVNTIYPGASADQVERFIINPLEKALQEIDGVKKMQSSSLENKGIIVLTLDPDQTTEAKAKSDIQDIVDVIVPDLPDDAEEPVVYAVESKQIPVIEVSLSGDVPEDKLRETALNLERKIESLREVAKVNINGKREREIWVEANPKKLKEFRLSLPDVVAALGARNVNIPGGTIDADMTSRPAELIVRTVGELRNAKSVGRVVIRANALGVPIRVRDVATVKETFARREVQYKTNGFPAMSLVVLKKESADAIRLVDHVKEVTKEFEEELNGKITVTTVNDQSFLIRRRLSVLSSNLLFGLALVLIVLSMILPWQVACVTAFGIPFSFLATMIYFNYTGHSLNMITMMGLIIVVGMLVDDAIVVTENAQRNMEEGKTPLEGAILGAQQVWAPVTVSVLTTVMAFAPMMFMSGIFGKFVYAIPLGVIVALMISLWEVFFILPHHVGAWVRVPAKAATSRKSFFVRLWEGGVIPFYRGLISKVVKLRYLVLLATFGYIAFTIVFAKNFSKFVLFPGGGIEAFQVFVDAPNGTPWYVTEKMVEPLEKEIGKLPDEELDSFNLKVGQQQKNINDPTVKRGGEYAQFQVFLTPASARARRAEDIMADLRAKVSENKKLSHLKITFEQIRSGPPVGSPISVGVRGTDYGKIMKAVKGLKAELDQIKGVRDIEDTFVIGKKEIHVRPIPNELAASGLSVRDLGTSVRAAYEGIEATKIRTFDEQIAVRVLLPGRDRKTVDSLKELNIPNRFGNLVPLSRIARFKDNQSVAIFEHEDARRQVRVRAELDEKVTTSKEVNGKLREIVSGWKDKYDGVSFHFGGEDRDTDESLKTLKEAFIIAVIGIFFIMILLFQNLSQPIIVLTTVPLGVLSVVWTLFLHGEPLSFMAFLGTVALSGVVVNNAIVFVDFVNNARGEGMGNADSIIQAGLQRLRPIFLTTVTTVVGILPTAYGIGGADPFVIPIAMALGWGMFFGAVLTTLILPAILAISDDINSIPGKIFRRKKAIG